MERKVITAAELEGRVKRKEKLDALDLAGANLRGAKLAGALLSRADLDGANLEGADLSGAELNGASLREAFLAQAKLGGAKLIKADLDSAQLRGADLSNADLSRANLEGATLEGARLSGASLRYAQLDSSDLGDAELERANLGHANMVACHLGGARAQHANFSRAVLQNADLREAELSNANFEGASLEGAVLIAARCGGAQFREADLSAAKLDGAQLTDSDLRRANLHGASLIGTLLSGARMHMANCSSSQLERAQAEWIDMSVAGDGSAKVTLAQWGRDDGEAPRQRRHFGAGDVLRNADLEFDDGAYIEVQSHLKNCTLRLGNATELVVGEQGALEACTIHGGRLRVFGTFLERSAPGLIGPLELFVSSRGAVTATLMQPAEKTRFAFERGCRLRMQIQTHGTSQASEPSRKPGRAPMSDDSSERKVTTVETETEFKGTLTSKCPVLVRGTVDGQVNAPELTVTETGLVIGQVNARELRSKGVVQGHLTGETMYISGTVRDDTVIRARSIEVNPERLTDPLHVVFGNCVLEVGDEPAVVVHEPRERATVQPAPAAASNASSEARESASEAPVPVPA